MRGTRIFKAVCFISFVSVILCSVWGYVCREQIEESPTLNNTFGICFDILFVNVIGVIIYFFYRNKYQNDKDEIDKLPRKPLSVKEKLYNAVICMFIVYTIVCNIYMDQRAKRLGHTLGNTWEKYMAGLSLFLIVFLWGWLQARYDLREKENDSLKR
ncbi:MAG: hypothetical protein IJK77_06530 [Lachnospiraceae bacterium]|nr:hypothetical protein [Lachnospiraceae bacterium]